MTLNEAKRVLADLDEGLAPLNVDGALRTALAECDHLSGCLSMQEDLTAVVTRSRDLLRAECERLRAARDEYHAQVRELRAENERLRQDAERYRWLRDHHLQTGQDSWIRTGADLEEAIDAAIEFGPIMPDELDAAK